MQMALALTFDLILSHILCSWQQPSRYLVLGYGTTKNAHNAFGPRSNAIRIDNCLFLQRKPRLCVPTTQLRPYKQTNREAFLNFISTVIWNKVLNTNGHANKQAVRTKFHRVPPHHLQRLRLNSASSTCSVASLEVLTRHNRGALRLVEVVNGSPAQESP